MGTSPDEQSNGTSRTKSVLPTLEWLLGYQKEWLRPDVIAGFTTAAVVIPNAMAYATIAGLPAAFLPMIVCGLFGTSRVLGVSTTTTLAIVVATELGAVVPNGDPSTLLSVSAILTLLLRSQKARLTATKFGTGARLRRNINDLTKRHGDFDWWVARVLAVERAKVRRHHQKRIQGTAAMPVLYTSKKLSRNHGLNRFP